MNQKRILQARMMRRPTILLVLILALVLMTACAPATAPGSESSSGATSNAASVQPNADTPVAPVATPLSGPLVLTLWTPDFMSTDPAQPGGALLAETLAGFAAARTEPLRVVTQTRSRYGKGGLLDYLRTAQPVAPGILPDVIALDAAELEVAVAAGAVRPLDGLIAPELLAGLYPAARALGRIGGQQYAIPFVLDIEHVVYDPVVTSNPPETWTGLLTGNTRYLFPFSIPAVRTGPAAGVPPTLLSHYLGAGYVLDFETRRLELNSEPMLRMLSFYDSATEQGQLDERPEDLIGLERTWQFYEANTDAIVQTSARQYLAERAQHPELSVAPAPGWSNPSPPIASGWVLAIVTPDPERQQRAAELLTWLMTPERNGRWAAAAGWLPVFPEGWGYWEDNPQTAFLDGQLKAAAPLPVGAESAAAALALQQAALSVVREDVSPVDAAQQALSAVQ